MALLVALARYGVYGRRLDARSSYPGSVSLPLLVNEGNWVILPNWFLCRQPTFASFAAFSNEVAECNLALKRSSVPSGPLGAVGPALRLDAHRVDKPQPIFSGGTRLAP